jgi:K+-transporting ATPase ATPase C chain
MRAHFAPALVLFAMLTLVTGVAYPLLVTGIAAVAFPWQANGSVLVVEGQARGSALIGQAYSGPGYFWGRLSATSPEPTNAAASSGSNYGPSNPALVEAARARIAALRAAGDTLGAVPVDLVTASASGLDPHITPAAAAYQVARVARARGLTPEAVSELVRKNTEDRTFGVLGEPRVNVLRLNLALDAAAGVSR